MKFAIMMLLGATQAIRITKVGDPVTATDASPAVESAHEGIADARNVNIGVRFVQPHAGGPVSTGTAAISESATEGITDARHLMLSDEPNTRNNGHRSMSQKWMGVRSAADPISPEGMDDWVYEYSKENTSSQTQWQVQKSRPSTSSNLQLSQGPHDQWQPDDKMFSDGSAEKVHVVEPANYEWYQNTNTLWGTPIMRSTFY